MKEDRAAQTARKVSRNVEKEAGRKADEDRLARRQLRLKWCKAAEEVREAKRRLQHPRKQEKSSSQLKLRSKPDRKHWHKPVHILLFVP